MKEFLTPATIANRVRMLRSQHLGAFLIVEGDTDARVYRHFISAFHCQIVIAHNRDNAVKTLAILEAEQFAGMLAIVDADFERLENRQPDSHNFCFTDTHDLETMICQSPALEKVLAEFGSEDKIGGFVARQGETIRMVLLKSGSQLGYLRWLSLRNQLALRFESLTFGKFVRAEALMIDLAKLVKAVKDHSSAHHLNELEIRKQMQALQDNSHDLWQVCCGHDLVGILSLGLRKTLGSNDAKRVEQEVISQALRLAYESAYFRSTRLYAAIQDWEKANSPYQVFSRN